MSTKHPIEELISSVYQLIEQKDNENLEIAFKQLCEEFNAISQERTPYMINLQFQAMAALGHSLSDVDMPYFDKIANSLMKDQVEWEISYHTQEDINRIYHFCKRLGISAHTTRL